MTRRPEQKDFVFRKNLVPFANRLQVSAKTGEAGLAVEPQNSGDRRSTVTPPEAQIEILASQSEKDTAQLHQSQKDRSRKDDAVGLRST